VSEEQPHPPGDLPVIKRRDPLEPIASPLSGNRGKLFLFSVLAIACAGLAGYMYAVQHFPWTDMRVIGPAIGAVWFGLRVFMAAAPKV
jgi:hypothetical protein